MGVLGEDDIEKLKQAFKNRNIPKRFNDPRKAWDAFAWMGIIAMYGIILLGATVLILWVNVDDLLRENKNLDDLITEYRDDAHFLRAFILENSDCPTLFQMY